MTVRKIHIGDAVSKCYVTGLRKTLNFWNNEFEILTYKLNRNFNIMLWSLNDALIKVVHYDQLDLYIDFFLLINVS